MERITVKAELIRIEKEELGYITYVFKLDNNDAQILGMYYIMCVRWPNWDCPQYNLNDVGYLTVEEVHAGVDQYYKRDTKEMLPYNYTNIQFMKFVLEKKQIISKEIKL